MATLKDVLADENIAKELFAKESEEAALAFLQDKGVDISGEDFKSEFKKILGESVKGQIGELSDDDLGEVSGGSGGAAVQDLLVKIPLRY